MTPFFQAQVSKGTPAETVTPLLEDAQDLTEAEVALKKYEEVQLTNSDYANMTFEEARQFFEEIKSEYDDIPASMTFEEALLHSNLFSGRAKRSVYTRPITEEECRDLDTAVNITKTERPPPFQWHQYCLVEAFIRLHGSIKVGGG